MHGVVLRVMFQDNWALQIEIDSDATSIDHLPEGATFGAWILRSDYVVKDGQAKIMRSYYQIQERNELARAFAKLTEDVRGAPVSLENLGAYSCCQEVYIKYLQSQLVLADSEMSPQWK